MCLLGTTHCGASRVLTFGVWFYVYQKKKKKIEYRVSVCKAKVPKRCRVGLTCWLLLAINMLVYVSMSPTNVVCVL